MSADLEMDAAEYVLGTLNAEERQAFAVRLSADSSVRVSVAGWEARLAGLASRIPPIEPPRSVWAEIERRLNQSDSRDGPRFTVIQGDRASDPEARLQRSLKRWRAIAVASSALAAALVIFVGTHVAELRRDQSEDVSYVAAVNRGGDQPALLVRVDLRTHAVYVRPVAAEAPPGKSLELWYIADGKPPRSMGVVDKTRVALPFPTGTQPVAATLAVSVEPQGGSTTGGPTGPVIYSGHLIKE